MQAAKGSDAATGIVTVYVKIPERDELQSHSQAKVSVGEVAHPMTDAHYIQWVAVANGDKLIVKYLHPGDAPEVGFCAHAVEGATVYAYCNLHGLWKTQA